MNKPQSEPNEQELADMFGEMIDHPLNPSKPLTRSNTRKGGTNDPPTMPRPEGGVGATKPADQDQVIGIVEVKADGKRIVDGMTTENVSIPMSAKQGKEPTAPIPFKIGEVLSVGGARLKLTYVNAGKGTVTFRILDGVRIVETSEKDPLFVDGVRVSGR